MTRKDALLAISTVFLSLLIALFLLRTFAPGLLGVPLDLRLARSSTEIPPFYRNVFRREDRASSTFLLPDPEVVSRAKPFVPDMGSFGPNDVLGFRNRGVPVVADVVTIGDSQTYGNNAPLELNWPSRLSAHRRGDRRVSVYNMSVGGWSALHYLEMVEYALAFVPRMVIVALYTGNDPLTDFAGAYGNPAWHAFRPTRELSRADAPSIRFPPPESDQWTVRFADGSGMTFTPAYRLASNDRDEPAVLAGFEIMARAAAQMAKRIVAAGAQPVFTIIPTKEWVYARRLKDEGVAPLDPTFARLANHEGKNIAGLARRLTAIDGAVYVDVASALSQAALHDSGLYPEDADGHPLAAGYDVIAAALSAVVAGAVPPAHRGLKGVMKGVLSAGQSASMTVYLVTGQGKWLMPNPDIARANGWGIGTEIDVPVVHPRELSGIPTIGIVDHVDAARFGPGANAEEAGPGP